MNFINYFFSKVIHNYYVCFFVRSDSNVFVRSTTFRSTNTFQIKKRAKKNTSSHKRKIFCLTPNVMTVNNLLKKFLFLFQSSYCLLIVICS